MAASDWEALSGTEIDAIAERMWAEIMEYGGASHRADELLDDLRSGRTMTADSPAQETKADTDWTETAGRDEETGFLHPRRCLYYFAGHCVHYIQAQRARNDDENAPVWGTLLEAERGLLVVEIEGIARRYRNHETERVREMVDHHGPDVFVQERWSLLGVPSDRGHYCFSIAKPSDPWRPCAVREGKPCL